jgi:hypothetical protein
MEHHHHCRRLMSHLHQEGCQICLLNDRKSVCPKEVRDSTTTKPAAMMHYYNTPLYQRSVTLYSNGQLAHRYYPIATVVSQ